MSVKENRQKANKTEIQRQIRFIRSLKTPCIVCGEAEPVAIDFHHIDPKTKEFNVTLHRSKAMEKIRAEAEKCICLCSNCHRKHHAGLLDISEYIKNPIFKRNTDA